MGSDWRDQISSIIADTNRNLGGRGLTTIASVPPLAYCSARPAEFESVFRGGPSATAGAISGGGGGGGAVGFNLTESPKKAAAAAAHQAHATSQAAAQQSPLEALMSDKQQANLTSQAANFQGSLQRILESVKFELDVRGSIAQKHMEAVREEMTAGMQEAERRCLDVAKQVDAAVGVRLDTERQIREQTNSTIARLQDTMSESHKETVRVVSDFQSTSIDHAEVLRRLEQELTLTLNPNPNPNPDQVLRRLEQELLAFKLDTETKLTEEARKLSGVIVDQRKIGENVDLAAADSTLGRLKEVELALLKEREMRKTLEHEVVAMQTLALTDLSPNQPQP